jgi:hypothetical protein
MPQDELSGPDLDGVVADANAVGLDYVVIGGFSVIFHGYVRATRDSDLLVPDSAETNEVILRFLERINGRRLRDDKVLTLDEIAALDSFRVASRHGIIDIIRGGLAPLDYETVSSRAVKTELDGHAFLIAALSSIVGFKRLAARPQDQLDLSELEALHGKLPVEPIPGLDTQPVNPGD